MVEGKSECIPETLESLKASFLFFAVVFLFFILFCFVSFYIPTTAFLLPILPPTLTPPPSGQGLHSVLILLET